MELISFIIGNGVSRKGFDLESLRNKGTIIGCNALHRDFTPDVLVAVDMKMIKEIEKVQYTKSNYFVVPANRSRLKDQNIYRISLKGFSTSGGFAIRFAGKMQSHTAYLLGFDCYGGNVYTNTPNYKQAAKPTKYKKFIEDYTRGFADYPDTQYINVIRDGKNGLKNIKSKHLSTMEFEDFEKLLQGLPPLAPYILHNEVSIRADGVIISDLKQKAK